MRPWTEKVYGIPPKQVIGSSGGLKYEMRKAGGWTIVSMKGDWRRIYPR